MRIIAGAYKGRKLYSDRGIWLRPTTDRVKTHIFDKIGPEIINSLVLDLFAGSGSLGIEALSRGAAHVTFVDQSKRSVEIIKKNLSLISNPKNVDIVCLEVLRFVQSGKKKSNKYDFIFADPPYNFNTEEILKMIVSAGLLSANGVLIYEQRAKGVIFIEENMSFDIDKKSFGTTSVVWFRRLEI